MNETNIKNQIMLELCKHGCKVFNRPTGTFYTKVNDNVNGVAKVRYVPYKMNVRGACDLQGHRPDGKAFYIEVKKPNHKTNKKHLQEQANFINQMRNSGALAGFAESVEQALKVVFPYPLDLN